jgi:hypothetical protein
LTKWQKKKLARGKQQNWYIISEAAGKYNFLSPFRWCGYFCKRNNKLFYFLFIKKCL